MSELKVIDVDKMADVRSLSGRFYCKYEVDKVIADLEESHKKEVEQLLMEIVKLKADYREACGRLQTANLIKDEQLAATRHHKFKRCLAMAKICQLRLERYEQYVTKYKDCDGPTMQLWRFLKCHYERWHKRWLALAKKFKEAK